MLLRSRLLRPPMELLHRRIIAFVALTWVPMAVLAVLAGTFITGVEVPFLCDLANLRFLIAMPLLIGVELVVHRRIKTVVQEFLDNDLIAPEDQPKFNNYISRALRMRNSAVAEVAS